VHAPENTLAAFAAALEFGLGYLETDVHASRDGVAVLSHDRDLLRMAGRPVRVSALTAAELAGVDLGHGNGFATLAQALQAFPKARFNIDVKSPDAIQPTVTAIRDADATGRVLIASFDFARWSSVVRQLPGVATSAPARTVAFALAAAGTRLAPLQRHVLHGVDAVQVPESRGSVRVVSRRMVRACHRAGIEVHVWTVNDPAAMCRLLDLGVDGLITDRVDVAAAIVRDRH
jgi:glycerophosphoryl diester phosphodiesterase